MYFSMSFFLVAAYISWWSCLPTDGFVFSNKLKTFYSLCRISFHIWLLILNIPHLPSSPVFLYYILYASLFSLLSEWSCPWKYSFWWWLFQLAQWVTSQFGGISLYLTIEIYPEVLHPSSLCSHTLTSVHQTTLWCFQSLVQHFVTSMKQSFCCYFE